MYREVAKATVCWSKGMLDENGNLRIISQITKERARLFCRVTRLTRKILNI